MAKGNPLDQYARSAGGTDAVVDGDTDPDPKTDFDTHNNPNGESEMSEQDRNQRIPLSEIVNAIPFQPQYVLLIVTEKDGGKQRVVHCDLREFGEALAIYDGANQYLRGEA
jgi:hypothetical protein